MGGGEVTKTMSAWRDVRAWERLLAADWGRVTSRRRRFGQKPTTCLVHCVNLIHVQYSVLRNESPYGGYFISSVATCLRKTRVCDVPVPSSQSSVRIF